MMCPPSLYYDVNVQGTRNVLQAMNTNGFKRIVFICSVLVYGLNKRNPNEEYTDYYNYSMNFIGEEIEIIA